MCTKDTARRHLDPLGIPRCFPHTTYKQRSTPTHTPRWSLSLFHPFPQRPFLFKQVSKKGQAPWPHLTFCHNFLLGAISHIDIVFRVDWESWAGRSVLINIVFRVDWERWTGWCVIDVWFPRQGMTCRRILHLLGRLAFSLDNKSRHPKRCSMPEDMLSVTVTEYGPEVLKETRLYQGKWEGSNIWHWKNVRWNWVWRRQWKMCLGVVRLLTAVICQEMGEGLSSDKLLSHLRLSHKSFCKLSTTDSRTGFPGPRERISTPAFSALCFARRATPCHLYQSSDWRKVATRAEKETTVNLLIVSWYIKCDRPDITAGSANHGSQPQAQNHCRHRIQRSW